MRQETVRGRMIFGYVFDNEERNLEGMVTIQLQTTNQTIFITLALVAR